MAVIPTAQMLPTEQTVAPRYPAQVPRDLLEAQPRAISGFGEALMNLGLTAEAQQKQGKDYALLTKFHDFQAARDQEYQDAQRNMDPSADPTGFHEKISNGYGEAAKQFFQENLKDASPEVKAKYDQKLYLGHSKQARDAANDEQNLRDNYYSNNVSSRLGDYRLKLAQDPGQYDTITQQAGAEIDAAPLPPAKKQKLRDSLGDFDKTAILHRLRLGDNPDEVLKDLQTQAAAKPAGTPKGLKSISNQLETPYADPLKGVANISNDTNNSKSYGNFGLNSQNGYSAWTFRDTYGKKLGITADPGTPEFDAQWRDAAKNKGAELVAAEDDWWQKNISSKVGGRLEEAGAGQLASDPRVQTYFSDREIQQGEGSTLLHKSRIQQAAAAAEGNPVKFLETMSATDKGKVPGDFVSYLRDHPNDIRGLENRVDGRLRLSLQIGTDAPAAGRQDAGGAEQTPGKYPNLDSETRMKLIKTVSDAARQKRLGEIDKDIKIIKQTGQVPVDESGKTALDRAKMSQSLTSNQIEIQTQKWNSSQLEHKMISGLDEMSHAEMDQHLQQFTADPKSPDYTTQVAMHDFAEKRQNQILALRNKDPALAVSGFGEVQQAMQEVGLGKAAVADIAGISVEQQPISKQDAWKTVIRARLAAQDRVGIPPPSQSPITRKEAIELLGLGDSPDAVLAADPNHATSLLREASSRAQLRYGPEYGSQAFQAATRFLIKGNASRDIATGLISDIASGRAISQRDLALYQQEKGLMPLRQFADVLAGEQGITAVQAPFGGLPAGQNRGEASWFQGDRTVSPFGNPSGTAGGTTIKPLPTPEQIKIIQDNPERWREVDALFGPGTAARAMKTDITAKPAAKKKDWSLSDLWGGGQ